MTVSHSDLILHSSAIRALGQFIQARLQASCGRVGLWVVNTVLVMSRLAAGPIERRDTRDNRRGYSV